MTMVCVLTGLALPALMLRRDYGLANYLGLERVSWRTAFPWIALGIIATLLALSTRLFLGAGPDTHANLVVQDDFLLYVVGTVLVAPLSEELFFRGFLITG